MKILLDSPPLGQLLAVQIRSRRICTCPKKGTQKKRHLDFALILHFSILARIFEEPILILDLTKTSGFMLLPCFKLSVTLATY